MKKESKRSQKILVGISGSIAAYKACDLIRDLRREGFGVIPVLSRDAHHFVTPLTLQSLSGAQVHQDMFALPQQFKPVHIELARDASCIALVPASADLIARVSLGLADDLLSCVCLATESPIVAAPAMNSRMLKHPATQEHLGRLKARGVQIVEPVEGELVCDENAKGHIASNAEILQAIRRAVGARQ